MKKGRVCLYVCMFLFFTLPMMVYKPVQGYFIDALYGVRPAGMGEAFVSLADDTNAVLFNPAGYSQIKTYELQGMYADLYSNLHAKVYTGKSGALGYHFISSAIPINSNLGVVGLAWIHFTSEFYQENTMNLSYGRTLLTKSELPWGMDIHVGANMKLLHWLASANDYTQEESKWGMTADLGVLVKFLDAYRVGLAIDNVVPANMGLESEDSVPMIWRAGVAYEIQIEHDFLDHIISTIEMSMRAERIIAKAGMEVWFASQTLALRLGVNSNQFTSGLGYKIQYPSTTPLSLSLDYSFAYPFQVADTLGSHRLGLSASWDPDYDKQKQQKQQKIRQSIQSVLHIATWAETLLADLSMVSEKIIHITNMIRTNHHIDQQQDFQNFHLTMTNQIASMIALAEEIEVIADQATLACRPLENADSAIMDLVTRLKKLARTRDDKLKSLLKNQEIFSHYHHGHYQRQWDRFLSIEKYDVRIRAHSKAVQTTMQSIERNVMLLDEVKMRIRNDALQINKPRPKTEKEQDFEKSQTASNAIIVLMNDMVFTLRQGQEIIVKNQERVFDIKEQLALAKHQAVNTNEEIIIGYEKESLLNVVTLDEAASWLRSIQETVGNTTGLDIKLKAYHSSSDLKSDLQEGKLDMLVCGNEKHNQLQQAQMVVPMMTFQMQSQIRQKEYLFVRRLDEIQDLKQLRGKSLGYINARSVDRLEKVISPQLGNFGANSFFREKRLLKNAESAVMALQLKEIDIIIAGEYLKNISKKMQRQKHSVNLTILASTPSATLMNPVLMRKTYLVEKKLRKIEKLLLGLSNFHLTKNGKKILQQSNLEQCIPLVVPEKGLKP